MTSGRVRSPEVATVLVKIKHSESRNVFTEHLLGAGHQDGRLFL